MRVETARRVQRLRGAQKLTPGSRGADHFIRDALADAFVSARSSDRSEALAERFGCRERFEALQSCKSVDLPFNREHCAMPYQASNRKKHGGGPPDPAFKMMQ
jgi:hypothetical protein